MKSCLNDLDISDKQFPAKAVLSIISSAKDKLMSPEDVAEQAANDYRLMTVSKLYASYQKKLKTASALDFDDIIKLTVELFEQFPDVLEHYQNRYKYIMVDEYQDTNMAQYRLVSLLSMKHNNLCVVGDDDQSIYKFRGATIENILSFEKQFENCKVIKIEQNYRSTQNILSAANSVIKNNNGRNDKKLWTDKGDGEKITFYRGYDERAEAAYVADKILDSIQEGKHFKDHAVLYRMNAQSNSIERAFVSGGIPYRIIGGLKFYDRKEIKDIIAYLSVINNHNDMLRLKRIINEPKRKIGDTTIGIIEQISNDLVETPINVMKNASEYPLLSKKASLLISVEKMFEKLTEAADTVSLDNLLDMVLQQSGYDAYLTSLGEEGEIRRENIEELKSNMVTYSEESEEPTLSGFLEEISLYTDMDKYDENSDVVVMMTMHSAKGLEFPTVFAVGMEEGIFPGTRAVGSPEDMEEERRLAYVAITRAKEKLYLTNAAQRMLFGSTTRNMTSRFVKEIDSNLIEKDENTVKNDGGESAVLLTSQVSSMTLQSQLAKKKAQTTQQNAVDLNVGERVSHNIFGEGTVLSVKKISNDAMVEIAFDKVGTKKLMANFAKIKKI